MSNSQGSFKNTYQLGHDYFKGMYLWFGANSNGKIICGAGMDYSNNDLNNVFEFRNNKFTEVNPYNIRCVTEVISLGSRLKHFLLWPWLRHHFLLNLSLYIWIHRFCRFHFKNCIQKISDTLPPTGKGFRDATAVAIARHLTDPNFDDVLAEAFGDATRQDYQVDKRS